MSVKKEKTVQIFHLGFILGVFIVLLNITTPSYAGWVVEDQKLTASDAAENDFFGESVAVFGDIAVVGAIGDDDADHFSGSAYVFVRNGDTWSQQAKLTASDAARGDQFGVSVDVSHDTIVVGAYLDDGFGSAYVFTRSGSTWTQQAKLMAMDAANRDKFGYRVGISGDTVLVGAYGDGSSSGSAYIFSRSGTTWSQQTKLIASDWSGGDLFGFSVAISGDTVVVGAQGDDHAGRDNGSVYVFTRSGNTWSEQAKLVASDADNGDNFGFSVAVSGERVVAGATGDDDGGESAGAAYIFSRNGAAWSEQTKLIASDAFGHDQFARSVAISGDTVVVGARFDDDGGDWSGSAYIFSQNGSNWSQQAKLAASDASLGDYFGGSVAVFEDTVVVGVTKDDDGGTDSGSARIFDLSVDDISPLPSNQWRQISLPGDPGVNNSVAAVFGETISGTYGVDGDWVLYRYDTDTDRYAALVATDPVIPGVGYWIIQITDSSATLALPNNSTPVPVTHPTGCLGTAKGCFEIPLATETGATQWSMISYPFGDTESLGDVRVLTGSGTCTSGCELKDAKIQSIVHDQLWTFKGTSYELVTTSDNLDPWTGYWAATLGSTGGSDPRLLVPKPSSNPPLLQ